jgi:hypothetical protein
MMGKEKYIGNYAGGDEPDEASNDRATQDQQNLGKFMELGH